MRILRGLMMPVIAVLVTALLNYLTWKGTQKTPTKSINKFTMRNNKGVAIIGYLGCAFSIFCIVGSSYAGEFEGLLAAIFIFFFLLGIVTVLSTVKGFYDTVVDGNDIKVIRFVVVRRKFTFDQIKYINILNQSFKVYGERGKLFSVDNLCVCYGNFIRRCKKEGIEVRVNGEKVEEEEKN